LLISQEDETFGEELKTMSTEERDTTITQTIFINILVTALAAGLAALVLVVSENKSNKN
jgi:hypothetical protein